MARRFPRATQILLSVLRPALDPVPVFSLLPDLTRTPPPVVMARRVAGTAYDPRVGYDQAVVDVQCWHTSDADADDLADACRTALITAWRNQTVVPGVGSIAHYAEQAAPALLPTADDVAGVYRYQATYVLGIRAA